MNELKLKVKNAPKKPGVYIFKNESEIIYVGKAKNISKRVSFYFTKKHTDSKTAALVRKIEDVDFMVTQNEVEALILENNLIKKNRPAYNISFKDDKTYPFIAVTVSDDFPRITITRETHRDGTAYFGPYTNVRAVRVTMETLRKIFPLRTCKGSKPGRKGSTPCLNFHIKRCLGPCTGDVVKEEYKELVSQVVSFLEGKIDKVINQLEKQMKKEAQGLNFEEATRLRNRLIAAKQVELNQKVVSQDDEDIDVLGVAQSLGFISVTVFSVRGGKLLASENFNLEKGLEVEPLGSFIKQYYKNSGVAPKRILVPEKIDEVKALEAWLTKNLDHRIIIHVPQKGRKKKLIEMANENAGYSLGLHLKRLEVEAENALLAAERLKEITGYANISRIECFDVSNISGTHAVASMVVFKDGLSLSQDYRKFKIKRVSGIDDYAMLSEALSRRLKHLSLSEKNKNCHPFGFASRAGSEPFVSLKDTLREGFDVTNKCAVDSSASPQNDISKSKHLADHRPTDTSFSVKPDLIVIDGGAGQLSAAVKAIKLSGLKIKVISIAKREEEIYVEAKKKPIKLADDDPALFLVQKLRDEAHRFAVTYHRQLRSKQLKSSALDGIEGIGEQKKKALINKFGSVENIKKATVTELNEVPGISQRLAKNIKKND